MSFKTTHLSVLPFNRLEISHKRILLSDDPVATNLGSADGDMARHNGAAFVWLLNVVHGKGVSTLMFHMRTVSSLLAENTYVS